PLLFAALAALSRTARRRRPAA
ncbi:MAG: hypothetical protein JWM10_696, partial [Myxococcaceae bacterium]|nr:hypothetical protein [Myxococcaceae bacterium]